MTGHRYRASTSTTPSVMSTRRGAVCRMKGAATLLARVSATIASATRPHGVGKSASGAALLVALQRIHKLLVNMPSYDLSFML
jgi:hypothetical protein